MKNKKLKILGTGLSGLVGSRIVELLQNKYEFSDLSLETGVDITDADLVNKKVKSSDAEVVLHMAAVTDVDACEKEKLKDANGGIRNLETLCWRVNVEGTKNVVESAQKYGKKLIYISTDFVFEGNKESYSEEDEPNPINWYGKTKYEAEKITQKKHSNWIIARLAFPYRAEFKKEDIVRFFLNKLRNNKKVKAVEDWVITPTFIDDIADALSVLINENSQGIYHVVGSSSHTPYEIALMISSEFGLDRRLVESVKLDSLFAGKAKRPRRLVLKNDKLGNLGVKMRSFEEGIFELKRQLDIQS